MKKHLYTKRKMHQIWKHYQLTRPEKIVELVRLLVDLKRPLK